MPSSPLDRRRAGVLLHPTSLPGGAGNGDLGPDAHRFVLIPAERPGVYWLQSVEFSALTFLLADPFEWAQDYSVELADDEMGSLAPADPSDLAVLGIITLPARPDELPTMNLQGPLAFNVRKRTGRQLVLQDDEYGVRFPVDLQGTQGAV